MPADDGGAAYTCGRRRIIAALIDGTAPANLTIAGLAIQR